MTRPAPLIAGIAAALLLLFGTYWGGYCAILRGSEMCGRLTSSGGQWHGPVTIEPTYRVQGEVVGVVFWPANQLDRLIRPDYWGDD